MNLYKGESSYRMGTRFFGKYFMNCHELQSNFSQDAGQKLNEFLHNLITIISQSFSYYKLARYL